MARAKKEKLTKVLLKLKRAHKTGFRLGSHLIKMGAPKEYPLNEKELKELQTKGPQHWLKVVTQAELDALPKSNAENKKMVEIKKYLMEKEVDFEGIVSLEELEELKDTYDMYVGVSKQLKEKGVELSGSETLEELEQLLSDSNTPA